MVRARVGAAKNRHARGSSERTSGNSALRDLPCAFKLTDDAVARLGLQEYGLITRSRLTRRTEFFAGLTRGRISCLSNGAASRDCDLRSSPDSCIALPPHLPRTLVSRVDGLNEPRYRLLERFREYPRDTFEGVR